MSILQLDPALPLKTPKGYALAHFLIDYGQESDLVWVCFQEETGEIWSWNNREVRCQKNITLGRTFELKEMSTQELVKRARQVMETP